MKLGHVHLKVFDIERSETFYKDIFGFHTTEKVGNHFAFLSLGDAHHDLALQQIRTAQPPSKRQPVLGLYHFAFELPNQEALKLFVKRLDERNIEHHDVDHGISTAVYFQDPDHNGLEVYVDTRHEPGKRKIWAGESSIADM